MAFADPLPNVTKATVAQTLGRVSVRDQKTIYQSEDGLMKGTISHDPSGTRIRSVTRFDWAKTTTDPSVNINSAAYLVLDRPLTGYTVQELKDLVAMLTGFLTATNVGKIVAQES